MRAPPTCRYPVGDGAKRTRTATLEFYIEERAGTTGASYDTKVVKSSDLGSSDKLESAIVKPKVLVTRRIFDESLAALARRCNVESNQRDRPFTPKQLLKKLEGKDGAICLLTDVISDQVLAKSPQLKIVCNVAVGYNNLDVAAATARGVMMTNTPGVLDDTTADFTWCLILATARGLMVPTARSDQASGTAGG